MNGTVTEAPADEVTQNGEPDIDPVATVAETVILTSLLVSTMHGKVDLQTT